MSLEVATYVNDLISTNPTATDPKAQGDDHLRLIKTALKASFPNSSRAFRIPTSTTLQTSTVTVADTDDGKTIPVSAEVAERTVNLPAGASLPDGYRVSIVKADHGNYPVTIDGNASETINGALTIILWQRYQRAMVEWSASLSAWLAHVEYIPPIGEVTPWTGSDAAPTGWLFPNGTTIGDGSSGASQRANADCRGLFYHLWNQFGFLTVSSGRGVTAAADFDAHKTIALPDLRGDTWVGLDNLGGASDAGRLTATSNGANTAGQTNGEQIGSESNTLATAQLPSHTHTGTTASNGAHTHTYTRPDPLGGAGVHPTGSGRGDPTTTASDSTGSNGAHTHSFTSDATGSGTAHANVQPSFVSAWKIKL